MAVEKKFQFGICVWKQKLNGGGHKGCCRLRADGLRFRIVFVFKDYQNKRIYLENTLKYCPQESYRMQKYLRPYIHWFLKCRMETEKWDTQSCCHWVEFLQPFHISMNVSAKDEESKFHLFGGNIKKYLPLFLRFHCPILFGFPPGCDKAPMSAFLWVLSLRAAKIIAVS